jgi:hypothetical protein
MKLRKLGHYLAGLLAAVLVLGLATTVLAATLVMYETWSGPFSFTLTITDRNSTGKLVKTTQTATGTVEMYITPGPDGSPAPDTDGYYMRFIDSQNGLSVGITALEIVGSGKTAKSRSVKIMGVGAGEFLQGTPPVPVGPAYLSLTGTAALDASQTPTSITATLTVGGGGPSNGPHGGNYIWSGKPKLVLHKQ